MEKHLFENNPEAIEIRKKAQEIKEKRIKDDEENKEPTRDDYEKASQNINNLSKKEEVIPETETKYSIFNEEIIDGGRKNLTVDETEKKFLLNKLKIIASKTEKLIDLSDKENLKWDISIIPSLNEQELEIFKDGIDKEARKEAGNLLYQPKQLKQKYGIEPGNNFEKLEQKEQIEILKNQIMENLLIKSESELVLRANITVMRISKSSKDESNLYRHYPNINLFGNKIIVKRIGERGEKTIDELVDKITERLKQKA